MANVTDFLPFVLPYVQGCTQPLALQQIRSVLGDFCTFAPIAQERLDPVEIVAGLREYDLDTAPGTVATLILQATYAGRPMRVAKTGDTDFDTTGTAVGTPTALMQAATPTFTLNKTPDEAAEGEIILLVATKPTMKADSVADILLNDYAYEIGQGVVARLMRVPNQTFSAPAAAPAYEAVYTTARTRARIRAEQSFGASESRVTPRRFGS